MLHNAILQAEQPLVMAILNVTPDSFFDGGCYGDLDQLKARVEQLQSQGADIIDIGGESTRPGAHKLDLQQELDRVMPALEVVQEVSDCWVSVDTYKPEVMKQALRSGIDMVNDVNALQVDGALQVCAESPHVMVCLMHKQGEPETMQTSPHYQSVIQEVRAFLQQRVDVCVKAGIASSRLVLDPGFGFGKTLSHNVELFKNLSRLSLDEIPLLVGVSRKSMLGQITGLDVGQRLIPSVVAAVLAAQQGAKILRVHDVEQTKQALKVAHVLQAESSQ